MGYQRAAIESLAEVDLEQHLAAYRGVTYFALVSLVCSLAHAGWDRTGPRYALFWVIGYSTICLIATNIAAAASSEPAWSAPRKILPTAVLFAAGVAFPVAPLVVGLVWLFLWLVRGRNLPAGFEKADLSLPSRARTRLERWRLWAWITAPAALVGLVVVYLA